YEQSGLNCRQPSKAHVLACDTPLGNITVEQDRSTAILNRLTASRPARQRFVALGVVGPGLSGRGDILGSCPLQNFLRPLSPLRIVGVNRKQDPAFLHATLVPPGFIFWDSHSDQGACNTTDRSPDSHPCPTRH